MKQAEFEKKYDLVGKGKFIIMTQKTKDVCRALSRQSRRIIEVSEDYAKLETQKFGETQ